MTAFLSLTFILLLSFVGGMMESASIQMAKNYRRTDMDRAIESVFAEYQKELLEVFDVFGLEGSYESGNFSEDRVLERLVFYGGTGIDNQVQAIRFLTDDGGKFFREQVARHMEGKYGFSVEADYAEDAGIWEEQPKEMQELEAYAKLQEVNLENLMAGTEAELPTENNPIASIKSLQSRPLLDLVMPEGQIISEGAVDLAELPSYRERRQGAGEFTKKSEEKSIGALAFGEYLLEHFYTASDGELLEGGNLRYELEYIIEGRESDKENLNKVIKNLLLMRMVSNYTFVANHPEKRAEAEAMAFGLAALVLLPEAAGAMTQVLLLSWAFGESVVDLRALLQGKKVPLVKNADSWQLSLSALSKLGTAEEQMQGADDSSGLTYKDYLRILLFIQEKASGTKDITMRALDMIEKRLRYDQRLEWFRVDNCISKLEINSICNLRRGIMYQFETYFGYQ